MFPTSGFISQGVWFNAFSSINFHVVLLSPGAESFTLHVDGGQQSFTIERTSPLVFATQKTIYIFFEDGRWTLSEVSPAFDKDSSVEPFTPVTDSRSDSVHLLFDVDAHKDLKCAIEALYVRT